jgi:anti-sigma factor RsiW
LLKQHLYQCSECAQHLLELEKTIALVQSLPQVHTDLDFTTKLMVRLPKEERRKAMKFWIRNHPFIVAASIFLFLMMGSSVFSWYGGDRKLEVSSNSYHALYIENGSVFVPENQVIEGDLIVRHGNIEVLGEVKGNVVAIDGKVLLASTAHISGQTEEINELLSWIWYKVKSIGQQVVTP